jgi:ABC-type uncharacterized transport system substrate-binding protein
MKNVNDSTLCKRVLVIAIAAIAIVVGAFVFLKLDPLKVSADNGIAQNVPTKQVVNPISGKQYKILHVMSYHSPWEWADNQILGFQTALKGLNVQYHVMQMDAKRKSDEAWLKQISGEIRKTIDTSRPDMIFISDDAAAEYVAKYYVNSSIPIVFSAVNAEPSKYGFAGSKNVTGVLERIHYVPTLSLLKKLVPNVQKIAIISDTGTMWTDIIEKEMKPRQGDLPDIKVVNYDAISTFDEFKQKVLAYQNEVDALGFLGIFEFKDENGKNVPMEDVLKWLQANSKLPDFSFWEDRVLKGTLCGISVSAYEQGYKAGVYARGILTQGKSPSEYAMVPTERGIPLVNLATAKRLNIKPNAEVLLTAKIIQEITLK